jgi:cysteine desulfurase
VLYLDYNATAPLRPEVRRAIEPLLFGDMSFGNASSIHWAGREAKKHLEAARKKVAELTARSPSQVIFTSGGSEADNLAIFGVTAEAKERRMIISSVEHPAVLEAAARLSRSGIEVVRIPCDAEGRLDLAALDLELSFPTALVSIMAVNNETGVIHPIDEVVKRVRHAGSAVIHVDAVQAAGRVPLPIDADLITLSGHKLGAPKGVGALLTKPRVKLSPHVVGGPQERGLRAGTEPVALAAGFAAALEIAIENQPIESERLAKIRDRIDDGLRSFDDVRILGGGAPRVSNTTTALFAGVEAETLLHALDLEGVAASSGSACSSGSLEPSHVLLAMGIAPKDALSAVRFSLGWASEPSEAERLLEILPRVLDRARNPL